MKATNKYRWVAINAVTAIANVLLALTATTTNIYTEAHWCIAAAAIILMLIEYRCANK